MRQIKTLRKYRDYGRLQRRSSATAAVLFGGRAWEAASRADELVEPACCATIAFAKEKGPTPGKT
jgi:hypothetical protein